MVAGEEAIPGWDPGLHFADFSAHGRQFQRSRRGHRLDRLAVQEVRPATLYLDEIRTPTYTDCLNRLCETMLLGDLCGIYHAGGRRRF